MPRPTKKAKQAKAQRESNSTEFTLVQPTTPFEASGEDQDPTYVHNSSGEEEVWTDSDIEDESATGNLAGDISALQTLYSKLLPPHMQSIEGASTQNAGNNIFIYLTQSERTRCTTSCICREEVQVPYTGWGNG